MTEFIAETREVLIVTPMRRDGDVSAGILKKNGIACRWIASLAELDPASVKLGAVILSEEILTPQTVGALLEFVRTQPVWSDLPLLILAADTSTGMYRKEFIERIFNASNATILQRPVPIMSLVSAVRAALRARDRQLQVKDLLDSREREVKERDDFLAMLGHELRNPLAPIRTGLQILEMRNSSPAQRAKVRASMERQVQHLVRMVDDLLDVARVSRGRIVLRLDTVDLTALLKSTVEDIRPEFTNCGLQLDLNIREERVLAQVDKTRITQVIGNLLHNARKFTERGGRVTLELQNKPLNKSAVISVTDNGMGMSRDMLRKIFHPFNQADNTLNRSRGGLGLGLVLARRLVELHGGCITADSAGLGQGSSFTVSIPTTESAEVAVLEAPQPSARQRRILIIEDNLDSADSLQTMLELLGHKVDVACNGPDGVAKAQERRPEIVLCDVGLPGMDGYQVARTIRNSGPKCQLIAITGYGQEEDLRLAREAGFDLHLTKPVDTAVLVSALKD